MLFNQMKLNQKLATEESLSILPHIWKAKQHTSEYPIIKELNQKGSAKVFRMK